MDSPVSSLVDLQRVQNHEQSPPLTGTSAEQNFACLVPANDLGTTVRLELESGQPLPRFPATRSSAAYGSQPHESGIPTSLSASPYKRDSKTGTSPGRPTRNPLHIIGANEWPNRLFTTPPPSQSIMAEIPDPTYHQAVNQQTLAESQSPSQHPSNSLPPWPTYPTYPQNQSFSIFPPVVLHPDNERIVEDCRGNLGIDIIIRTELFALEQRFGVLITQIPSGGDARYICTICKHPNDGKGQRRWDLSPHILTHASKELKPWGCACGKKYARSHDLKRHARGCKRSSSTQHVHEPIQPSRNNVSGSIPSPARNAVAESSSSSVGVWHGMQHQSAAISETTDHHATPSVRNDGMLPVHPTSPPNPMLPSTSYSDPYHYIPYPSYSVIHSPLPNADAVNQMHLALPSGHGYNSATWLGGPRPVRQDAPLQPQYRQDPPHYYPDQTPEPRYNEKAEEVCTKGSMLSMCKPSDYDLEASKRTRCNHESNHANKRAATAWLFLLIALGIVGYGVLVLCYLYT